MGSNPTPSVAPQPRTARIKPVFHGYRDGSCCWSRLCPSSKGAAASHDGFSVAINDTLTLGDMVRVTDEVFKNFVGHIWRLEAGTGKVTIRQGTPEDWHRLPETVTLLLAVKSTSRVIHPFSRWVGSS